MSDPIKSIFGRLRRCCAAFATAELQHGRTDRWQSLLYDGGRHHIELAFRGERIGEAIESIRREIADDGFAIAGHIVAEIRITGITRDDGTSMLTLKADTIEA